MARGQQTKQASDAIEYVIEGGRLINGHLFVKNAFKDEKTGKEGSPRYRCEVAWPKDDPNINACIDDVVAKVREKYGEDTFCSVVEDPAAGLEEVRTPFIDGDNLAKKREKRGKKGDAYKGQFVIRADTAYNYEGQDADGGITVYDEQVQRIPMLEKGKVYNGSMGTVKVSLSFYEDNEGNPACKFYLKAWQKTGEGEKLASEQDHSSSFKPVGRQAAGGEAGSGRRQRRG